MPNLPEKRHLTPGGVEELQESLGITANNTILGAETSPGAGEKNVFLGNQVGREITTAKEDVAVGAKAGSELSSGSGNVFVGCAAGKTTNTGAKNTYVGNASGNETTGSGNIFLGCQAGETEAATSNTLLVANNPTTPIIKGVMSATAAENELGLGTSGGKIGFLAVAAAPVVAKAVGAETTAAIWARLKELGLTT